MKQTESAGGVVLNRRGEVLIVNQHGTSWSLPKGHIEEGEDPPTTARREIAEESGITDLKLVRELGTYQRYKIDERGEEDTREHKTITMFLFTTTQQELKPVDPENPEARWVEKGKVAAMLTHAKDREFFLSIIDKF